MAKEFLDMNNVPVLIDKIRGEAMAHIMSCYLLLKACLFNRFLYFKINITSRNSTCLFSREEIFCVNFRTVIADNLLIFR